MMMIFFLLLLFSSIKAAIILGEGSEFQVNSYTTGVQYNSDVAGLSDNNYMIVWEDREQYIHSPYYDYCISMQAFNVSNDQKIGVEVDFRHEYSGSLYKSYKPKIAASPFGGYAVTYMNAYDEDVWARCYDSSNTFLGTSKPSWYVSEVLFEVHDITVNNNGEYYVATIRNIESAVQITKLDSSCYQTISQYIFREWIGSEDLVDVALTTLENDDVVVVFGSDLTGTGNEFNIKGQMLTSLNVLKYDEFLVNVDYTTSIQRSPAIARLINNHFVVVWQSYNEDGSSYGIFAQIFNETTGTVGQSFQVNTQTNCNQQKPAVDSLKDGSKFFIVWEADCQGNIIIFNNLIIIAIYLDGSSLGIYGQFYNSSGHRIGNEFRVNSETTSAQQDPAISSTFNNKFVVSWTSINQDGSNEGVFAKSYSLDEIPIIVNNEMRINESSIIIIDNMMLSATDEDNDDNSLVFTVSNVMNGYFETQGEEITSFNQQEIIDEEIRFIHDGDEVAPFFDISVSDGLVSSEEVSANIIFYNVNDMPILNNNAISINQGETKVFTSLMLSATDIDDNDLDLIFYVNNIQGGYFERDSDIGTPITDFIQSEIISGSIFFVHDDFQNPPSYEVKVSDGKLETSYYPADTSNFNYRPEMVLDTLYINQGETLLLKNDTISATDLNDDVLIFLTDSILNGYFEKASNPGEPIFTFSLQDIEDESINFVHDGSTDSPSFKLKANDMVLNNSDLWTSASIVFNQCPYILNNNLRIQEGESISLNTSMLSANDVDSNVNALVFSAIDIVGGYFEENSNHKVPIFSFTQQQIIDKDINFVHDGKERSPSYNIIVSDDKDASSVSNSVIVEYSSVNDYPILLVNSFIVDDEGSVTINDLMFNATDVDNDDNLIQFIFNNIQNGYFERSGNQGIPIVEFSKEDILDGVISFVHNTSGIIPSCEVKISDGELETSYHPTDITLNLVPELINNELIINEGEIIIIDSSVLSANDVNNDNSLLSFTVRNVEHGYFDNIDNADVPITTFIQQDISDGKIRFVHGDSEFAPSYEVRVSDGRLNSVYSSSSVSFTPVNDNTPILGNNLLTIDQGATVIIDESILSASDVDNNDMELIFIVNGVQHGIFVDDEGEEINTFTQNEIHNGYISFIHDDSEIQPSYQIKVSDGDLESDYVEGVINFNTINDNKGNNPEMTGLDIVLTISIVLVFVIVIIAVILFVLFLIRRRNDSKKMGAELENKIVSKFERLYPSNAVFTSIKKNDITPQQLDELNVPSIGNSTINQLWNNDENDEPDVPSITNSKLSSFLKADSPEKKKKNDSNIDESFIIPFSELQINKNDLIGKGGFGSVYIGKWQKGTKVAVKILNIKAMTENSLTEFKKEASLMSKLSHPNVLTFYGVCIKKGFYGIVTHYMSNGSLYQMIHSKKKMNWDERYRLALGIANGIKYLHSRKLLHRDLKSLNILLKYDDKDLVPMICDFGLSKIKTETSNTSSSQNSIGGCGTPAWMAPELFSPTTTYTKSADIFSYGMILWEIATRKNPWEKARLPFLIAQWVVFGEREEIPSSCCSIQFSELIQNCWKQNPKERPSIDEIIKFLESNEQKIIHK